MINKKFIEKLKKEYQKHEGERRQIISLSNIVLHDSKRIIFALHRGEVKEMEEKFKELEGILQKLDKQFGHNRIISEGAYKACVEEYVEAKMFYYVLSGKKVDAIKEVNLDVDSYLGGICDLTGELLRYAVNEAAGGNFKKPAEIKKTIGDIMAELVTFDMTGYQRTKYDQAKGNLRKIEQIDYEIKLRK
jgi:predicted translin family RNA/ssDNA-binding protein